MTMTHTLETVEVDIAYDAQGPQPTADGLAPLFMIGQPMTPAPSLRWRRTSPIAHWPPQAIHRKVGSSVGSLLPHLPLHVDAPISRRAWNRQWARPALVPPLAGPPAHGAASRVRLAV
jgi:hypothetical protein